MLNFETLEELVQQRKGYKFLRKDRTSPYQKYKYVFRKRKVFKLPIEQLNKDINTECGVGWNLATLPWILANDSNVLNSLVIEFSIPEQAEIIVPTNSNGKFRTDIIRYEKIHKPGELFPQLLKVQTRLKQYKPINPITATKMPHRGKIKAILSKVRDQVRDQVGAQVWDQVGDQVGDQVRVISYYAVKLFLKLDYEHPAFDLIRLGIIAVKVANKFKIFGKKGKYLGEIDAIFLKE